MIRTTPFHERLRLLDTQGLYTHWQGYLSPLRYSHAPKHEYFAVRNAVGVFDTSPLYKYRIAGPDAERLLAGVMTRDIRGCRPGHAQYTVWCDERGFVMADGVVFRHSCDEFLLTAARPNLAHLESLRGRLRVQLEDVSDDFGVLAVQGPRSRDALAALAPELTGLPPFEHIPATVAGAPVMASRTGYTGDLGYELTVPADDALGVLDAVLAAGSPYGMRPFGEEALMTLRIEAGLVLLDVDFHSSRLAFTDADRVTPTELGMGWMLRGVADDSRPFLGREAILRELEDGSSRWATAGVVVDWQHWDRLYRDAGLLPPKDMRPLPHESMLYDAEARPAGYVTSFAYSPVLQRHIGIARIRPDVSAPGSKVLVELTINHETTRVTGRTARLPLFDPERRKATP